MVAVCWSVVNSTTGSDALKASSWGVSSAGSAVGAVEPVVVVVVVVVMMLLGVVVVVVEIIAGEAGGAAVAASEAVVVLPAGVTVE